MKSTAIARTSPLVIRKPPLVVVLCLAMWTVSLVVAFHHPPMTADIEAASAIVAP